MSIREDHPASAQAVRPTHVVVDLARLKRNLEAIRAHVRPARVMIVVKANAYGHGLAEVAQALGGSADYAGVAVVEEGILLRQLGLGVPILILGAIWEEQIPLFLDHDLTMTVASVERLQQIEAAAAARGTSARVHLKIDTGMERIGVQYYNAESLQQAALDCSHVEVEGIYSHFANADAADLTHARLQLERFNEVLRFYERHGLPTPMRHMANSAALLNLPESHFDMVRPGIMLYGVYPSAETARSVDVRPALSWKSRVVYFKVVRPGHPVSYGSTWQSDHPVRVVTLPVGYGDGYFRSMSNRAQVLLGGRRVPQVGRICMDQMMVNLESGTAYHGDEAVLLGRQGDQVITAEDLAQWAGTIPYEILTNIGSRVPRVYTSGVHES